MKLALLASGNGTNVEALLKQKKSGKLPLVDWKLLVCNNPNAFVLERVKVFNLPSFIVEPKNFENKETYETCIHQKLIDFEIDGIVLAGYMRLIGPTLLKYWKNKIINIHPSLLPSFPGKNSVSDVIKKKFYTSGCTVHFVDEGIDTGPIIAQKTVLIEKHDNQESLSEKIHKAEHELLPRVIRQWSNNKF